MIVKGRQVQVAGYKMIVRGRKMLTKEEDVSPPSSQV